MLPRRNPSIAPCAPHSTSSSAGGSLTIVISTSAAAAVSRGFPANFAPSLTSSSARAAVRFHTTSGNPACSKLRPIGLPITPNPINPTVGFIFRLPYQYKNIPAQTHKCECTRRFHVLLTGCTTKEGNCCCGDAIFSSRAWARPAAERLLRAFQSLVSHTRRESPRASFSVFRPTKNAPARKSLCPYRTPASRSSTAAYRPRDNALPPVCPAVRSIESFHLSRPNNAHPSLHRLRQYIQINKQNTRC